jgi:GNAT superfamily N-acetyltransferase
MIVVQFRVFGDGDLAEGWRLSTAAGWNQTELDWRRFRSLAPEGCFVAECEGSMVGVCAAFLFGSVGWIAMMLVDERWRQRGIGRRLMERSLAFLEAHGAKTIRLDATPLGRPMYEKLGFTEEYWLSRYRGAPTANAGDPALPVSSVVPERWSECCEFDRRATGVERAELLRRLFTEQPEELRAVHRGGEMVGYVTGRPGRLAAFVGPCVAIDDEVGAALMAHAYSRRRGEPAVVDIPRANDLANRLALAAGLAIERPLLRMRRGPACDEHLSAIWGSSGPEKG